MRKPRLTGLSNIRPDMETGSGKRWDSHLLSRHLVEVFPTLTLTFLAEVSFPFLLVIDPDFTLGMCSGVAKGPGLVNQHS